MAQASERDEQRTCQHHAKSGPRVTAPPMEREMTENPGGQRGRERDTKTEREWHIEKDRERHGDRDQRKGRERQS